MLGNTQDTYRLPSFYGYFKKTKKVYRHLDQLFFLENTLENQRKRIQRTYTTQTQQMPLSDDQERVIDAIGSDSVVVQANPGAGKTTTACAVARAFPHWVSCLLTYSSRLKEETRCRVVEDEIETLHVHSYHSFAKWTTKQEGYDDLMLMEAIKHTFNPACRMDLLILDEQQDQTWLYWKLVSRIISEFQPKRLLVLGDARQCVFAFAGADSRFLTLISEIVDFPMQNLRLTTSFRMTHQIAFFVNRVMLNRRDGCDDSIVTVRDGPPVTICTCNIFSWGSEFLKYFTDQIRIYGPGNTFILAPSIKLTTRSQIVTLQEHLVSEGIPVYVPSFEDALGKEEVMRNKVVFCTYNASKGRERELVFVLTFDMGYNKFYDKTGDPLICSNVVYVAATRAKNKLVMVRFKAQQFPAYANIELMADTCDMRLFTDDVTGREPIERRNCSATDLVAHLSGSVAAILIVLKDKCFCECWASYPCHINVQSSIKQADGEEEVSTITSLLVNSELMLECTGQTFVFDDINKFLLNPRDDYYRNVPNKNLIVRNAETTGGATVADKIRQVLVYNAIVNRESFRLAQIKRFDWITEQQLFLCSQASRENLQINEDAVFEQELTSHDSCRPHSCEFCEATAKDFGKRIHISARLDVVTSTCVIENKATREEALEHFLQLVVYSYIWSIVNPSTPRRFLLYYQLTGRLHELTASKKEVLELMKIVVDAYYQTPLQKTNTEFVAQAREIYGAGPVLGNK